MGYLREGYSPEPWLSHWEERPPNPAPARHALGSLLPSSISKKQAVTIAVGAIAIWLVFFRKKNGRTVWDKMTGKRRNPRRRYRRNPASQTLCTYVGDPDAQLLGQDTILRERLGLKQPFRRASDRLALLKAFPGASSEDISRMMSGTPANAGQVERRGSGKKSKSVKTPKKRTKKQERTPKKQTKKTPVSKKKSRPAERRKPRNKKGGWKNKPAACRVKLPKKAKK